LQYLTRVFRAGFCLTTITVLGYGQLSTAQDAQPPDTINSYTLEYFDQFTPRNALDMIARVPGFQLRSSENRRGLGQGGANILINGERISGKTNAEDQLARINAANVVRIDIVDGATLDIPGLLGRVANITTKNTGVSTTWQWRPQFRKNVKPNLLRGSVTVSGETGDLSYAATLRNTAFRFGNFGLEERFTPDGFVFETRDETARFSRDSPGISTSLTWKPKDGHVVNLNAEYNLFDLEIREISRRTAFSAHPNTVMGNTVMGDNNETLFLRTVDAWNASVGADYELPAGPKSLTGKLKIIAYYRFRENPAVSIFDQFTAGAQSAGSRFGQASQDGEAIVRTEYSLAPNQGKNWQLSLEGAFNFVDIASSLEILNPTTGDFFAVPVPGGTSRVEEQRGEFALTHSRALLPNWDVQITGGFEYSQISQTGDANQVRDFFRPKGLITTSYKPSDSLTIRTRIEREVGQLNFSDFISTLNLQDDLNNTGNSELVPNQAWVGSVEFDKNFGQGNTFNARFYGELISDLIDRIPVGIDGDAVGNIDNAKRYGVDFTATIKGDKWGFKGTQLDLRLDLRNSEVDDPLTGLSRRLNEDKRTRWDIEFRHDIPNTNWAYGGTLDQNVNAPSFRLDTISLETNTRPLATAFVEHKDIYGLKIRAGLRNLLDQTDNLVRQAFTTRRDLGQLEFTESRVRPFGVTFSLDVSGTF